jgi:excinuclease ABC subunit A
VHCHQSAATLYGAQLVFDTLDRALCQRLYTAGDVPGEHDSIDGSKEINRVITIDQQHFDRFPRSNLATYADVFTPIRQAFAAIPEARQR